MAYSQLTTELLEGETKAVIKTNMGDVTVKLLNNVAPKTVENFVTHAKNKYYDGLIFHRVIKDFMIQGGDPTGTGMGGESIWGQAFEDEFSTDAFNLYGALSMANAGPNTNGSQFFIVQLKDVPSDMVSQLEGAGYPAEIIESYKNTAVRLGSIRDTLYSARLSRAWILLKRLPMLRREDRISLLKM